MSDSLPLVDDLFDRLRPLLDALPLGVLLLDGAGRVLTANRRAEEQLGKGATELTGQRLFRDVVPEWERVGIGHRFRTLIETGGSPIQLDATLPISQGEQQWFNLILLRPEGNDRDRGVMVLEDRTPLMLEQERRRRAERLASVGELAAGVAHEVNNPLAAIKSFAQLLARDAAGTEQRQALELIIQESTRVAGIVANLLSFARKQGAGGREPIDLNLIAERVLTMQRYALETVGIQVRRDFDASLSPVMGESGALEQVMLNLVVNAEQALASKGGERLLIVRTRESSEGVILSVVDNGPGIPRELLSSIFDPFRTTKPEGTGLGLGISATVVREHGGNIWAESEEGRGAAFFVRLPRAEQSEVAPVHPAAPAATEVSHRALRILIADDEPNLRLAVALFLTRRGHQVTQAADAHEAARLAEEQEFDVALVDVRMPGDGLVLLERLEAMPSLRGRTALMTGDIGRARTSQGITTGRPYLTKPFDLDEMVRLLETLGR